LALIVRGKGMIQHNLVVSSGRHAASSRTDVTLARLVNIMEQVFIKI
jgi:hypothetical protein